MRFDLVVPTIKTAQRAAPALQKLKKASEGIEAMFVKDLMSTMRKSPIKTGIQEGFGGAIYKDMFDQAVAASAGKQGNLGIAKMLNQQFSNQVWANAQRQEGNQ